MLEGPVYLVQRSIFISASPYLIFGERGKTVWESSQIANLQNIDVWMMVSKLILVKMKW